MERYLKLFYLGLFKFNKILFFSWCLKAPESMKHLRFFNDPLSFVCTHFVQYRVKIGLGLNISSQLGSDNVLTDNSSYGHAVD